MKEFVRGGNGSVSALINKTEKPYLVHYGYDTVRNGYAQAIICPPGGYALRIAAGDPYGFAKWQIGDNLDEFWARKPTWMPVHMLLAGYDKPMEA